jgi:hypothetical protein
MPETYSANQVLEYPPPESHPLRSEKSSFRAENSLQAAERSFKGGKMAWQTTVKLTPTLDLVF